MDSSKPQCIHQVFWGAARHTVVESCRLRYDKIYDEFVKDAVPQLNSFFLSCIPHSRSPVASGRAATEF